MVSRRVYAGGAAGTTTTGALAASGSITVPLAVSTGWPTGGASGKFAIVVDRGTASEEKMLVTSRTGLNLTVDSADRGADGSSAKAHGVGATVEHCILATDLDEANAHIADTGRDDHTQYLTNARHDITGRHAFGAALGTPGTPTTIGSYALAAGSGPVPARSDHAHTLDSSAADGSTLEVNAGSVRIKDLGVTSAKLANDGKLASGLRIPVVCTSGTRPGSPTKGDMIYETDTGLLLIYYGGTTLWQRPWAQPWGLLNYAEATIDQASIGTGGADLTGVTTSFTAVANRRYRIFTEGRLSTPSTALTGFVAIKTSGGTDLVVRGFSVPASGQDSWHVSLVDTFSAGSTTIKVNVATSTGTVTSAAGSTYPACIGVEDVGPLSVAPPAS